MTPRTRNSNRDADFKVYYSKNVPQQVHFPHKRKTVRQRTTPVRGGREKRQMIFLPDKMREQRVVDDSEDSGSLETDTEESIEEGTTKASKQKGRKRDSDIIKEEPDSEHDDSIANPSKRRRKTVPSKSHRRTQRIQATSDNEADGMNNTDRERTLRRQSTMTQLVDGRKPLLGVEEPDFKPVKKPPRLSWSGKGKKSRDEKQRTLTQMVPGMRPLDIKSDEDLDEAPSNTEAEEKYDQAYGDAVARRLAQQGLYQTGDNNTDGSALVTAEKELNSESTKKEEDNSMPESQGVTESIVQSVEGDCDDSYKPTQFIEAPSRRPDRATRCNTRGQSPNLEEISDALPKSTRSSKFRFSLLSTPEKRRIREIPSSQSPADSPISTRVTPHKSNRSPLKQCRANSSNAVAETPSKRKQVVFSMPSKTPVPPPKLRRFESTIQDSEDEEGDIIEEDTFLARRAEEDVDESVEVATSGKSIGVDTQRMLGEIDRACDEAKATGETVGPEPSPELGDSPITRGYKEPFPGLGESHEQSPGHKEQTVQKEQLTRCDGPTRIKQEPESEDVDGKDYPEPPSVPMKPLPNGSPRRDDAAISIKAELPADTDELHSSPPVLEADFQETSASTPMVLKYDSSDEERSLDRDLTPPRSSRRPPHPASARFQQSTNLDDESIQVPRSPSLQYESQKSDSSKAEQQLQNEWLSYSQYVKARPPGSSSVRVAPDAFSYDATPRPPRNPAPALQHHSSGYRPSQATTVDEITQRTPRAKRTQHFSSTHTTPHRIPSSQPVFTTPNKLPPPLFIPSSFPSPEKVSARAEGWSSPIMGMTQDVAGGHYRSSQWASLEDFSIPPPPPPAFEEEDE
ncbi:uncharacterized protein yc1106_08837 [Curvularia clavata]|uniref:Uncharacterized protein n=1 Tax=Curvularia clavata TaxID=95742 RepID=A0A9Q9DUY5_CURCL|nr:uncharacterized protein yc1106_08837 [Curvularia clavata]